MRRPATWGGVAAIAMIALALPAFGLRLANPPNGGFSANLPIIKAIDAMQRAFPQAPSPGGRSSSPALTWPGLRSAPPSPLCGTTCRRPA